MTNYAEIRDALDDMRENWVAIRKDKLANLERQNKRLIALVQELADADYQRLEELPHDAKALLEALK